MRTVLRDFFGGQRGDSAVQSIGCSTQRPRFESQNPQGGPWPSVALVPEALRPFYAL